MNDTREIIAPNSELRARVEMWQAVTALLKEALELLKVARKKLESERA